MKVLYVIPGLGSGGGAERSLVSMVPHLSRSVDLRIATLSNRAGLLPEVAEHGVPVVRVGSSGRLATVRSLRQLISDQRPDLVHTTLWDADVTARPAAAAERTPVTTSLVSAAYGHDHVRSPDLSPWRVRAAQGLDAATARMAVGFHAVGESVADAMSRRLALPRDRIEVIPRGRDPEVLGEYSRSRREEARRELGGGSAPLVVAVARHSRPKGLDVLVRAAPDVLRVLPETRFVIGGPEAEETPVLESLIGDLGLQDSVEMIGRRDDVAELMCAADVFCVPSRREGLPGILIEAMALGTPTVATAIPPVLELAGEDPWLELVPPDSPEQMAKGILAVLTDPSWRSDRGSRARQRFLADYQVGVVSDRLVSFFEAAAERSRWN